MNLTLLPGEYAVCRLDRVPERLPQGRLVSLTVTPDEVSLVCPVAGAPAADRIEPGWAALMVEGPLDFGLVGILAELTGALAAAGVAVFAVSTFDTDYLLVRLTQLDQATAALELAGHSVRRES
jgi:hypothetical protein